ncbi:hypothetical protein C8R44DRAFT_760895 [Mycena epipterygia]|nr:hypothetical protein C8R44DRAFT_760895 [Mycena epipterygia]
MGSTMDFTYGAMFIGVLFATFFQGVLTVQAYIYYESFPDDPRRLKFLVAVVWILDVIHLVLICQACYHYLITSWGNDAALLVATTAFDLHLIFVALPTLVCQAFFIHRIWTFSKRNWLLTSVLSGACLSSFGLQFAITARILGVPSVSDFSHQTAETVTAFALNSAVDVCIALVLVFYLQQQETHFDRTNFVVGRIIRYTVATGLATSMLAIASMVACLASPRTFVFIAIYFSLGRLYTNALLATLNSRRSLRLALQAHSSALAFTAAMNTRVITTRTEGDDCQMGIRSMNPKDLEVTPPSR